LRFRELADGSVASDVTLAVTFQGWHGVAHGGIVALLLDEAMAYAAAAAGALGMTAALRLRFRAETPLGEPLRLTGRIRWRRRNVYAVEAALHAPDGTLLASGDGSFVEKGRLAPGQRLGWERFGEHHGEA